MLPDDPRIVRPLPWLWQTSLAADAPSGVFQFDASDIVQQTLLEACRDLPKFRGGTEAELLAWLRQILAHVLAPNGFREVLRKAWDDI